MSWQIMPLKVDWPKFLRSFPKPDSWAEDTQARLTRDDSRQQEFCDRRACADRQRADFAPRQVLDLRVELVAKVEDPFGIRERHRARGCQRDAAAGPIEQARIEMILELPDLKRDGRLGHA